MKAGIYSTSRPDLGPGLGQSDCGAENDWSPRAARKHFCSLPASSRNPSIFYPIRLASAACCESPSSLGHAGSLNCCTPHAVLNSRLHTLSRLQSRRRRRRSQDKSFRNHPEIPQPSTRNCFHHWGHVHAANKQADHSFLTRAACKLCSKVQAKFKHAENHAP